MASIKGHGAPTIKTKGRVGQTYHDLDSGWTYKCVSAYSDSVGNGEYGWKALDISEYEEPIFQEDLDEEPEQIEEEVGVEEVEEPVKPAPQPERRNNYGKPYNKHQYNKPNRN